MKLNNCLTTANILDGVGDKLAKAINTPFAALTRPVKAIGSEIAKVGAAAQPVVAAAQAVGEPAVALRAEALRLAAATQETASGLARVGLVVGGAVAAVLLWLAVRFAAVTFDKLRLGLRLLLRGA